MKKILFGVLSCLVMLGLALPTFAFQPSDEIYHNEKVLYDLDNNLWGESVVKPEKKKAEIDDLDSVDEEEESVVANYIILTKKTTSNVNRNTVLTHDGKEVAVVLNSTYEVLKDGKLIAIDNNNLKYYQVIYSDGKFVQIPLTDEQLQKLFPKAEIVKISQFKDDTYITSRGFFETKTLLLVNDTDRSFFKYSYKHPRVQVCDVRGLVKSNKYETIKFSHYGDSDGALTIKIKRN